MTQPVENRGGYRRPEHPAPVSGPGRLSQRTDGQPIQTLPDAAYGEQKTFREIQQGAPMGGSPPAPAGGEPPTPPIDMSRVTPLNAPSQFPEEPVTAGADAGLGVGPSGVFRDRGPNPDIERLRQYLPALEIIASMPSASEETRSFYRTLKGMS